MTARPTPFAATTFLLGLIACACGGRTPLLGNATQGTGPRPPRRLPPSSPGVPPAPTGACPDALSLCGPATAPLCFDLQTSTSHCGACGKQCPLGIACVAGRCDVYRCRGGVTFKVLPVASSSAGDKIQMSLGDLDGDGVLDLLAGGAQQFPPADPTAGSFLGKGDGTFVAKASFPAAYASDSSGPYSALADVNQDGILDVAVTGLASSVNLRLGVGDGSFGDGVAYPMGAGPAAIVLADMNGDGQPDLVTAAETGAAVTMRFGAGDGSFGDLRSVSVSGFPRGLTRTDWNGDGTPDLVATDDYLHVLLGAGGGSFTTLDCGISISYQQKGGSPPPAVVADFDQDGRMDLVVGNGVLFGMDGCNFNRRFDSVGWFPLLADDFDGDGLPDLVTLGNGLTLLTTQADGSFAESARVDVPAFSAVSGDLNGDGRIDMVLSGAGTRVLLNTCR